MMPMESRSALVETVRQSYLTIGSPRHVMLGLSGGADSLALFHILHELKQHFEFRLSCVYVNHHLRKASDDEAAWLKILMGKMDTPFYVQDVIVPEEGNLEDQARWVRYQAFDRVMKQCGADILVLAHHADDQAETMLMRLMYGTGLKGLSAMRELNGHIWRPLLQVSRKDLEAFLKSKNQTWLSDESNQDYRFLRNAIRHRISPVLEELSPGVQMRMAQTARLLGDEEDAWRFFEEQWLRKHASASPPLVFLRTASFGDQPLAFQRRLVRRLCEVYDIPLDREQTEILRSLPNSPMPVRMNLPRDASAYCTERHLHIIPANLDGFTFPDLGQLLQVDTSDCLGDGIRTQTFDADKLQGVRLRRLAPGDRISPLGMIGSQPMTQYLSDRKIDLPLRRFWPVLAKGDQVLWAIGLGCAQTAAVTEKTRNRIRYVYEGALPGELTINQEGHEDGRVQGTAGSEKGVDHPGTD